MRKFFLAAAVAVAALFGSAASADAAYQIRVTSVNGAGTVVGTTTFNGTQNADGSGVTLGSSSSLPGFSLTIVNDIGTSGPNFVSSSFTLNVTYTGTVTAAGPPATTSNKLIVEVLASNLSAPPVGATSFITSNGSPSTSGLRANSVVMTSGVISGNAVFGAAGTTLGGQLGATLGTGTMGNGIVSSVLNPNPANGVTFAIPSDPFTFYQTYTLSGFTNRNQTGSLSAGSTLSATPAPAGLVLALAGMPVFGLGAYIRRRRNVTAKV